MRTMRMEREDIENSLKVLSHIVDDDFIITVDEARKIIGIDGETIEVLQAKVERLQAQLPKQGEWLIHSTGGSMATKKCPFCGSESWQSKEYAKVPKYCQNCGAHLPTFNIMDWVDYLYAKTEVQE